MIKQIAAWLMRPWRAQQRAVDLRVLWPAVKQEAMARGMGLDQARAAFAVHALHDPAWLCLGEKEIARRIDGLQP